LTVDPTQRYKIVDIRASAWYRQIPEASIPPPEQNVDGDQLDESTLSEMEVYGFPRDYIKKCLGQNKHNHTTTTYRLLLERRMKLIDQADESDTKEKLILDRARPQTVPVITSTPVGAETRRYCTTPPLVSPSQNAGSQVSKVCQSARGGSVVRRGVSPVNGGPPSVQATPRYASSTVARNNAAGRHQTPRSPPPSDAGGQSTCTSVGRVSAVQRRVSPSPAPAAAAQVAPDCQQTSARKSPATTRTSQGGDATLSSVAATAVGIATQRGRVVTPRSGGYQATPRLKAPVMTPRSGSVQATPRLSAAIPQISARDSGARSATPRITPRTFRYGQGSLTNRLPSNTSTTPTPAVRRRLQTPTAVVQAIGTPTSRMIWR